jgi:NTE family protein
MPQKKKPRIALVVGSGSVKCAAALGLWNILQKEDIPIDMFVGCSGGSLYTSCMALGFSLDQTIGYTKKLWNEQVTEKRNTRALLSVILPGMFRFDERFSMVSDKPMLEKLRSVYGDMTFADTKTPLYIAATDFHTGEQVIMSEGSIVDAIRSSISIPFIWPAWKVGDRMLVDGAVSSPMPVDVAIKEGAEIILALGFQSPLPKSVKSISRYAFHINGLMTNNLYQANFSFHNTAHHAEIIPIFPEFDRPIRLFDTDQIPYVIEQGEKATLEQVPYIRRLLETLPV